MGRISTSSSFAFFFIVIMLSLYLPFALARSSLPSASNPHDLLSVVAAKQVGSWPCCDKCGFCTKSFPPLCNCLDLHPLCPPECKSCVEEDQNPALSADAPRKYRCEDVIVNFCKYTCTSASVLNQ
ncbi:hypothetical protein LUZ61_018310 [Rhynchospora tenuis]|uniref:Bowman-Birk serine protease inhibitors family domain-containing protein n=1 Tax=Rhynchospora tenuis TaxID=198213 RepID=A0AAD6ELV5_9POAL|nr:hypothetical protein LUZ61_018310 [Rhynchospora tenuis]